MAELFMLYPLFPGATELEQIDKIMGVIGSPSRVEWPDAYRLSERWGMKLTETVGKGLEAVVTNADAEGLDLIEKMLRWNPKSRPSIKQVMKHPFFTRHTLSPEVQDWLRMGGDEKAIKREKDADPN